MKYLVTGCAGFIGSSLVNHLLEQNHEVLGIDRLDSVLYSSKIKKSRLEKFKTSRNFQFIEGDILTLGLTPELYRFNPEIVINEAGLPGQSLSWTNLSEYTQANFLGAYAMAQLSIKLNVRKFIQASTSSIYGKVVSGDEDIRKNPASPYGVTKLAAEQTLELLFEKSLTELVILRYFSVYGPHQRPDMGVHRFINSALNGKPINIYGDGNQSRDFTYIDDAVMATQLAAEKGLGGASYNIAGGEVFTVNNLLDTLDSLLGEKTTRNYTLTPLGDQQHTSGVTIKAQKDLGWYPKKSVVEGLSLQLAWQRGYK